MEIKPGTVFGKRFEFRQHLASGGLGQVWEGFDCELKRPVAVKRLLKNALGKVNKSELIEEAQRVAALNHPNIVALYDVREIDDEVFIIMEFLPGRSLHDRMRKMCRASRWISISDGVRLVRDILAGLEAAHRSDGGAIIHRDLKPQNVLFNRNDTAKIVDFGLAAVGEVDPLPTFDRRLLGEHVGTMGYKSPEQLKGLKLDPRTDLFNVGLIAYLVFSAIHPFVDERFLFTHREMALEPYRPMSGLATNTVPPDLEAFILRLLEGEAANRFETATQALSEFENVEKVFRDMLQDRCLRLHDCLVSGAALEAIDSTDLATGISLLKQAGFYPQAKLLYEKGGLDISQLSPAARSRVNEAYATCVRRLEKREAVA